jgi:hypothetical protein
VISVDIHIDFFDLLIDRIAAGGSEEQFDQSRFSQYQLIFLFSFFDCLIDCVVAAGSNEEQVDQCCRHQYQHS